MTQLTGLLKSELHWRVSLTKVTVSFNPNSETSGDMSEYIETLEHNDFNIFREMNELENIRFCLNEYKVENLYLGLVLYEIDKDYAYYLKIKYPKLVQINDRC